MFVNHLIHILSINASVIQKCDAAYKQQVAAVLYLIQYRTVIKMLNAMVFRKRILRPRTLSDKKFNFSSTKQKYNDGKYNI